MTGTGHYKSGGGTKVDYAGYLRTPYVTPTDTAKA
jgi:hypothetical protein